MPNIMGKIKRDNLEKQINKSVENGIFDIHYSESENCSLVRSREVGYRYVIKYSPEYEILIIWNRNAQKYSVSFTWTQLNEYLQHEYCKVLYERRRKNNYDKVVAIRRDFLPAFLEDYDALLTDKNCNKKFILNAIEKCSKGISEGVTTAILKTTST